ncbi:hypothetical protein [Limoniibacter endophyticus]|uniref:Lipoprotein n=1 Tax=Limoniibacter endophyticus TaxID=1565040 RepID=A0A8J3GGX8_9HYPH|nr:hypothetical protein [Limoniibacter endophyticus]GHC68473.1 hypothetical protein GCM10010136_13220 [Limoniibacter endophyticus]
MNKMTPLLTIFLLPVLTACNQESDALVQQDNLICNFTEPFFALEYDAASGNVFYTGVDTYDEKTETHEKREFAKNARIVNTSANAGKGLGSKLELKDGEDRKLLDLTVDFKGSDGMSDNLYPITALQQGKYGPHETGCTTTSFPPVEAGATPSDDDARRLIEQLVSR